MKNDEILEFIEQKTKEFFAVRRILENEKLMDEVSHLRSENSKLNKLIELYKNCNSSEYDPGLTIHEIEKRHILGALKFFNGDKIKTSNAIGITIKSLYNKLHEYGELKYENR